MRFQVEFQPRVRGVRHHSDMGPGCTNVEEVYHIFDKVLNLLELSKINAKSTEVWQTVKKEKKKKPPLTNMLNMFVCYFSLFCYSFF